MPPLDIRRANAHDAPNILALLNDAGAWLRGRGIEQWPSDLFSLDGVLRAIDRYDVYVAYDASELAGTIRIQWRDPVIWGSDSGDIGAAYVHRLAINRALAGQKIGRRLLTFAEEHAKQHGKTLLRLDCWAGNDRLRRYYLEAGFRFVDEITENEWQVARFEREITYQPPPG